MLPVTIAQSDVIMGRLFAHATQVATDLYISVNVKVSVFNIFHTRLQNEYRVM